ncbi:MAG: radical SAM-associated putative lipoprotein [Tidjanibacter sp.]|nr:radical SAM-associated putative lipoprotein [Tidjanibacter sp.]
MKAKLTAKLLALLGFSTAANSCEALSEIGGGGNLCMYGTPSATYIINAEVVDEEEKPIHGIKVSVITENSYEIPEALTDFHGKCTIKYTGWPQNEIKLVAEDIDGTANSGEFESANAFALFDSNDYKDPGESGWFKGTATKRVKFQLNEKE